MRNRPAWAAIFGAALLISGCGAYADHQLIAEAKEAISQEIKDPSSAEFRNVQIGAGSGARDLGTVCGEVNGKNSFGAYGTFRRFIYVKKAGVHQVEYLAGDLPGSADLAQNQGLFDYTWRSSCEGKPSDPGDVVRLMGGG